MTGAAWLAGSSRQWRRVRMAILIRDQWRCRVPVDDRGRAAEFGPECGLPANTVDHIVPRAMHGSDDPANLRAACARHNYGRRVEGIPHTAKSRREDDRCGPNGRGWVW